MLRFAVFVSFPLFSPNSLSTSASTEQITAFDLVSCCVCIGSLEQTRYADFCASVFVRAYIRVCVCVCVKLYFRRLLALLAIFADNSNWLVSLAQVY